MELSLMGFRYAAARLLNHHQAKIERSAEAFRVRHTRHIFPSKDNFAHNTTRVIARSKGNGWQNSIMSLRGAQFATKQSPIDDEIASDGRAPSSQ